MTAALLLSGPALGAPAGARSDEVAYLVNVTVRPGYGFISVDDALAYGSHICDKIAAGDAFAQIVADVKADRGTSDDYQATYLIGQAANEFCPAQIWALRHSAAGHDGPGGQQ